MSNYNIQRIQLDGPQNVRDLVGFTMMDGKKIPKGRLIRSCELSRLSENDKDILLNEHDLKTIVDLRTELEKTQVLNPVLPGVQQKWIPVLNESMLGVTKEAGAEQDTVMQLSIQIKEGKTSAAQFMKKMYKNIVLSEHAAHAYHDFFEVLLSQKSDAVLWHCSAGKDRAGVATMLVLTALDAPRDLILEDYLMVNQFLVGNIEYNRKKIIKFTGDAALAESMIGLFAVEKSYAEYAFSVMDEQYGSSKNYLKERIGISENDLRDLRKLYLV